MAGQGFDRSLTNNTIPIGKTIAEYAMSMLRLSIINDRLEEHVQDAGDDPDMAFLRFAYATINHCDYDELQPEDIVDGGQDKQIDVLSIEEDAVTGTADIFI